MVSAVYQWESVIYIYMYMLYIYIELQVAISGEEHNCQCRETVQVRSWWEDPLERAQLLNVARDFMDRGAKCAQAVQGPKESDTTKITLACMYVYMCVCHPTPSWAFFLLPIPSRSFHSVNKLPHYTEPPCFLIYFHMRVCVCISAYVSTVCSNCYIPHCGPVA